MISKEINRDRFDSQMIGILESAQERVVSAGSNLVRIDDVVLTFLETNCVGKRILTGLIGNEGIELMTQRIREGYTPQVRLQTHEAPSFTKNLRQLLNKAEAESQRLNARIVGSDHFLLGLVAYYEESSYPPFKNIAISSKSIVEEIAKRWHEATARAKLGR